MQRTVQQLSTHKESCSARDYDDLLPPIARITETGSRRPLGKSLTRISMSSSSLLLVLLASSYISLCAVGVAIYHCATGRRASLYTLDEICWFVQGLLLGLLTLPWAVIRFGLFCIHRMSYLVLCEVANLYAWLRGIDEITAQDHVAQAVVVIAVVAAAWWVSTQCSVGFVIVSVPIPYLAVGDSVV